MFLRMKPLPGVDNLRNYPAEIIKELEELLLSGGSPLDRRTEWECFPLKIVKKADKK